MKKYLLIISNVILFILCIYTFINMKFTYNYFRINTSSDINIKKKEIHDLNKENIKINNKIEYVHMESEKVKIPILMYHSISDINPMNSLLIPEKQFEEEIKWLRDNNFTPMLLSEVVQSIRTGKVPKRPVAITFDDGYFDNYTDAYRILKKYNMIATFFIVTDYVGKDSMYMNLDNLKEMKSNGMAIENHTSDHLRLYFKTKDEQKKAIKEAKEYLKENLNIDNKYVCYPVGRYNKATIEVAKELGMEAAVTTKNGFASNDDGLLSLDRIRIKPMSIEKFKEYFKEYMK